MPTRSAPQFLKQLHQTKQWCAPKLDIGHPKDCLRSKELGRVVSQHDADLDALWISAAMVDDVSKTRMHLLGTADPIKQYAEGRILLSAPDYTNHNAISAHESDGYLDNHDAPPWDSWICAIDCSGTNNEAGYSDGGPWPTTFTEPERFLLASWVPDEFVSHVDRGIEVECVGMIFWASSEWPQSKIAPQYRRIIPRWFRELYGAA